MTIVSKAGMEEQCKDIDLFLFVYFFNCSENGNTFEFRGKFIRGNTVPFNPHAFGYAV